MLSVEQFEAAGLWHSLVGFAAQGLQVQFVVLSVPMNPFLQKRRVLKRKHETATNKDTHQQDSCGPGRPHRSKATSWEEAGTC